MVAQNLLFFDKKGLRYNFVWNGSHWEGAVLFPKVSEKLFEVEHIFIIEEFLNNSLQTEYGYPHSYGISNAYSPAIDPVWRTRWVSDYDGQTDVSSIIYTYELGIDPQVDGPVLVKANNVELYPEEIIGDYVGSPGGLVITNSITSSSMQINIALSADSEGIYDRDLIIEDYTDPNNPVTILRVSFHGEVEGEDSRLSVLLSNFGRTFVQTDSFIVRETDIKEPLPDFEVINKKRKELLLTGESIFPYIGSYKALFNAIKFFGYYDLRIKEYWLNVKIDTADVLTPLQQNSKAIKQLAKPNLIGQNTLQLISSFLQDENEGKFKQVEIYGKRKDGTFGLKKQFEEIFPSKSYKKTALFGLFYDINRVVESEDEDQYGYPVVEDVFAFSPEEVLIKLFGLKERLKRDYLPLNARIIDITGEGVYFNIYKTRGWVDQLGIDEAKSGIKVDFDVFPQNGYIDDLRVFYTKPNQNGILYPAIDQPELGISYYGNTVDPYSYFQQYPVPSLSPLIGAIKDYYVDIENGFMPKFLGDGDYDFPSYKLFSTGEDYVLPAGCPVVITNNTFVLTWEEISGSWNSLEQGLTTTPLDIASYTSTLTVNPGSPLQNVTSSTSISISSSFPQTVTLNIGPGNNWFGTAGLECVFVRIESIDSPGNLILGYAIAGGYNSGTGALNVQVISTRGSGTYGNWKVSPTNINFSTYTYTYFQNWVHAGGFYSWDRLPFLDFYEIEWTIYKEDDRPYFFQIRGNLPDLESIPHFLPYTGDYIVQCRVWDTLNAISLGIKRSAIKVEGRQIDLNTLTRYRESERYDWSNMPLKWDSYPSQWIWPVENTDDPIKISDFIQNFPEYSNNFNEGQNCEVLTKIPEVKATAEFDLGVTSFSISTIQSPVVGGGYGLAVVTTTAPHGFSTGDQVWITDSLGAPYGSFPITVLTPTTFNIPQYVIVPVLGGSVYGSGSVKVTIDGAEFANCVFQGDLESTVSLVYSTINSSPLFPKSKVITLVDSIVPGNKTFTIQAPNNTGSTWNGKTILIQTTGSIFSSVGTSTFSGGVNETSAYVPYDFNYLPNPAIKYWGSKRICWDTFEDFEFAKAYAHSWDMFDYHNDWLGGFNLYSLQYGDRVRVTDKTPGIVFQEDSSPSNSYLGLYEAAKQLNESTDENISRFNYVVRGYSELPSSFAVDGEFIDPELETTPAPQNVVFGFYKISSYSPPITISPTGMAWDADGDLWVTGEDLIKFDFQNYTVYNSTNSVIPGIGLRTNCIKIDSNDVKWIGIDNSLTPLVKIDEKDEDNNIAFDVTDFVDNQGNPVCPNLSSTIRVIEINPQNGDIFLAYTVPTATNNNGLLYFDGAAKSWSLYNPNNSDLPSSDIRDMKIEYYGFNKWYLWIAGNGGLTRFDGVSFINYRSTNSGMPSNNVYSIEIDKLGHKWIGYNGGLVYWDNKRWRVWNNTTNPELSSGIVHNIVETGNSNIWFVLDNGGSPTDNELYFFDGYVFTKYLYTSTITYWVDGYEIFDYTTAFVGNTIAPCPNPYGRSSLSAPWKTIKNGDTTFPRNLIFVTERGEICKVDYTIPHIHATAKFSGTPGWDFVYHETSSPLPSVENFYNSEVGNMQIGFNFILGPFESNITLNSDYTGPELASVDQYSWYKPIWQRYNIDYLKNQFPSLDLDNVFLYAPLRDIISGKATRESYWKNSQIERIAQKKSRDLLGNFEWLVTMGSANLDQGTKITVDSEGDIIVVGDFSGTIFLGEVNNIPSQDVYLTSSGHGVYTAKYNSHGVLQWGRAVTYGGLPSIGNYARSVISDVSNNIYIAYENNQGEYMRIRKYNSTGNSLLVNTLLSVPINSFHYLGDIKVDKYENVYICGSFKGDLQIGTGPIVATSTAEVGYICKFDSDLNPIWFKPLGDLNYSRAYELTILNDEQIFVVGTFDTQLNLDGLTLNGLGNPDLFVGKFYAGDGQALWLESFAGDAFTSFSEASITMDPKGHVLITGGYQGKIEFENKTVNSFPGTTDIFVIKLLSTGKLMWLKTCGGASGDTAYDVESDSQENVYITGSFTGIAYFSPEEVDSQGGTDIFLTKFNKDGLLVDIVTAGGMNNDKGADLALDKEENLYITGYFQDESNFYPYLASPPGGALDAFLGKIPKERFRSGYKIGAVQSWLGSHAWSWREERFYQQEFEIPLASTIFINPIDSLIPGKKEHVWSLVDTETGQEVVNVRKTPYFIWTFTSPGFYSISCQLQDANGNLYETEHKGKIRVIDHKEAFAGDLVPDVVNPEDYLLRTIYYDRKELGFPPLSRFGIGQEPPPPPVFP